MFSLLGLGILSVPSSASAQCVGSSISPQISISGSKQPTSRQNNVRMNASGPCTGSTSHTGITQVRIGGTQRGQQNINVDQQINGSSNSSGINGTTVLIQANPQIDVYNAADDF